MGLIWESEETIQLRKVFRLRIKLQKLFLNVYSLNETKLSKANALFTELESININFYILMESKIGKIINYISKLDIPSDEYNITKRADALLTKWKTYIPSPVASSLYEAAVVASEQQQNQHQYLSPILPIFPQSNSIQNSSSNIDNYNNNNNTTNENRNQQGNTYSMAEQRRRRRRYFGYLNEIDNPIHSSNNEEIHSFERYFQSLRSSSRNDENLIRRSRPVSIRNFNIRRNNHVSYDFDGIPNDTTMSSDDIIHRIHSIDSLIQRNMERETMSEMENENPNYQEQLQNSVYSSYNNETDSFLYPSNYLNNIEDTIPSNSIHNSAINYLSNRIRNRNVSPLQNELRDNESMYINLSEIPENDLSLLIR